MNKLRLLPLAIAIVMTAPGVPALGNPPDTAGPAEHQSILRLAASPEIFISIQPEGRPIMNTHSALPSRRQDFSRPVVFLLGTQPLVLSSSPPYPRSSR